MPLQIIREDITRFPCDAIVNAANETLLGRGGVDGAIHRAAGPGLLAECRTLGGCRTGQAKITAGYDLPCKYVIHTVGPVWHGGLAGERRLLISCYRQSLALARDHGCQSVAFPLISAGVFGYPKDKALRTAVDAISAFLLETDDDMTVYLLVFGHGSYLLSKKLFADVRAYINDHYADTHCDARSQRMRAQQLRALWQDAQPAAAPYESAVPAQAADYGARSLEDMLAHIDESFSQMLLRKIDERGMSDAQCYKKANIDRKLFSKIRGDIHYKPSKPTAIAFAIALELDLEETREMLMKAGYALSPASKFDVIIEYFIRAGNYNIFQINETLFAFDQSLLGA